MVGRAGGDQDRRLPQDAMIRFNGKECGLCLLDTNAVSEMVKNPDRELRHYFTWASDSPPGFVPGLSVFTLVEMRHKPALYQGFLELFDRHPCALVKVYDQLVEEEVRTYPDPSEINPLHYVFSGAAAPQGGRLKELLGALFTDEEAVRHEQRWNAERDGIVEGIRSLVPNFPPAGAKYTPGELRNFLEIAGFTLIGSLEPGFAQKILDRGEAVNIDAFPSVKSIALTVWHKFYADRARRPSTSDAFDVIISSVAPYVDAIVTENHLAEGLRQTRRRDDFLRDLRVFTLEDFRHGPPSRTMTS